MSKASRKVYKPWFDRRYYFLLALGLAFALLVVFLSGKKYLADLNCNCETIPTTATGEFNPSASQAIFNNKALTSNWSNFYAYLSTLETANPVLGANSTAKRIEISLSQQRLLAYEGDRIIYTFPISSGKWAPTPTGEYRIWAKIKYQRMTGGSKELHTFYDLPNVPYVQYFYKGFGIHGAYWHNNFGTPMSHGCINMAVPDSKVLFYWTNPTPNEKPGYQKPSQTDPGTPVFIRA